MYLVFKEARRPRAYKMLTFIPTVYPNLNKPYAFLELSYPILRLRLRFLVKNPGNLLPYDL